MKITLPLSLISALLISPVALSDRDRLADQATQAGKALLTQFSDRPSNVDSTTLLAGLREALALGSERAVAGLAQPGGYLEASDIHIPLPNAVRTLSPLLEKIGLSTQLSAFETSLNRAAERAVPQAAGLLSQTISTLRFEDVQRIYNGANDEATRYLERTLGDQLTQLFQPEVEKALQSVGATRYYSELAREAETLPFMQGQIETDLNRYVTEQALAGLFTRLAEQEALIRQDPLARSSLLLRQLWGSQ